MRRTGAKIAAARVRMRRTGAKIAAARVRMRRTGAKIGAARGRAGDRTKMTPRRGAQATGR